MKQEAAEELIKRGFASNANVREAMEAKQANGESVLINLLFSVRVTHKDEITNYLARHYKIPVISLNNIQPDAGLIEQCDIEQARKYRFLPITFSCGFVVVGMLDPLDPTRTDELSKIFNKPVKPVFIRKADFEAHIHEFFHDAGVTTGRMKVETPKLTEGGQEQLIVKLLNSTIYKAVRSHATQIEFLPEGDKAAIRFGFEEKKQGVHEIPLDMHGQIVAKIKKMAKLDIRNTHESQTGQCKFRVDDTRFALKVCTSPQEAGEQVLIHILDLTYLELPLGSLGFNPDLLSGIKQELSGQHGIILVCGPRRSGRSSTLYSLIRHAKQQHRRISTVEDPVKCKIEGVSQIQVDATQGVSFPAALQNSLVDEADTVMLSNLPDMKTGQIAINAAGNGHLILAAVETKRAVEAIQQLTDKGLDPSAVAAQLKLVIGQRLLRKLCPSCKSKARLHDEIKKQWGIDESMTFYTPKGCEQCLHTGFEGRIAVHEVMFVDDDLRKMIASGTWGPEIEQQARYKGMLTLFEAGMNRAIEGSTSLEEVLGTLPCPDEFSLQERLSMGRVVHLKDPADMTAGHDLITELFGSRKEEGKEREHEEGVDFFPAEPSPADAITPEQPGQTQPESGQPSQAVAGQAGEEGAEDLPTVLLVDDSPTVLEFIKHILSVGKEFRVDTEASAEAAWEYLQQKTPDLVITDFILPRMSGQELIGRIRQTPALANVGTMLMTAKQDESAALTAGADAYIGKPTDPELLIARAKSIISIYQRSAAPAPQQQAVDKNADPGPGQIRRIEVSTLQFDKAAGLELDAPAQGLDTVNDPDADSG